MTLASVGVEMSGRRSVSRRLTAAGYGEAMRLAWADWSENIDPDRTRHLIRLTISEGYDPGWNSEHVPLPTDFTVVFEFDSARTSQQ